MHVSDTFLEHLLRPPKGGLAYTTHSCRYNGVSQRAKFSGWASPANVGGKTRRFLIGLAHAFQEFAPEHSTEDADRQEEARRHPPRLVIDKRLGYCRTSRRR